MSYPGEDFDREWRRLLCPADHVNPTPQERYHLVVVGAGPAGLICAIGAAGLGAKVALVERHMMGGDCLNVGCVPSKALLEATRDGASFDEAFAWLRQVRAGIAPHDSVERYAGLGVDVFLGDARFDDSGRLTVGDTPLAARRVALCTGARASVPPIPGLIEAEPLTNETVFDLLARPSSVAILGAGPIGCELATVFARLGTAVDLFEMADRVLPLEDADASAAVAESLQKLGVVIHVGEPVSEVHGGAAKAVVCGGARYPCEEVVVALGRQPNTDTLDLAHAGIEVDERGYIRTDAKLRTSNKHVFAAGDCTARLQFTHHADAQARVVVQNALFAPTASVSRFVVPHCTYTRPEVASVGATRAELDAAGTPYDVVEFDFAELDRGRAEREGGGFARVLLMEGADRVLGATLVGHDAGEQIAPICLLMSNRLGLSAAGKAILPYPTRSEYLKRLADAYNRSRLTPSVARLFRAWLNFTG